MLGRTSRAGLIIEAITEDHSGKKHAQIDEKFCEVNRTRQEVWWLENGR